MSRIVIYRQKTKTICLINMVNSLGSLYITLKSGVRIPDYAIYCRLQEIQVSSPGESDLLNNYADYRGKTCKRSSTWCK